MAGSSLLVLLAIEVAFAVLLRINAGPPAAQLAIQIALALTFTALALVDLRLAVAVSVLELIVGGSSGSWTVLPGGVSGRMLLNVILGMVSVGVLYVQARAGKLVLGRYTLHALAIAVAIPAIWIPIGIINGNGVANAIADGDGFLFFGLAVILAAAATRGDLGWLRRWVLACSVAGALMTLSVAAALEIDITLHQRLVDLFIGTLGMGGRIDAGAGGLRVYFASGLFLQVGIAIAAWELMRDRRRVLPWLALGILVAGLFFSFTRGYWLGAVIAASVVLIFGQEGVRSAVAGRSRRQIWAATAVGIAAFVVLALFGTGGGMTSNVVKVYQAAVLTWHTLERPLTGWGFGAVVPDYLFGNQYTYEITYLDRAFKLGLVGLAVFLSLPLRLLRDSWRVLNERLEGASGLRPHEGVVALAILASVLVVSATNPYMVGSVGIGAVVLTIAWLDPFAPAVDSPLDA